MQVELDNALSKAYTKVELVCLDRKGLLFDIMRTLKDIGIRVAYGVAQLLSKACCAAGCDPLSVWWSVCRHDQHGT